MVKPRRKLSFSENCHQFYKIYLPDQCSQRLKIPREFIKYFNEDLPHKSTIRSPAKRSWQVDVNKVNDNLYFHEGWQQFVQDNSLEFGDFLIFYYGGNANFSVKIYGKNGCRKEVAALTRKNLRTLAILQDNQTVKQRKSKRLVCDASGEGITKRTLRSRVPMAIQGDVRALEAASKFKSKFPFFKVVMKPAYVNNGLMNIPSTFLKSFLENDRQTVTLVISDKSWLVKLVRCRETRCKFSMGWLKFSRENTLKTGDVCVFELVETNDFVLKVSIFKC